MYELLREVRLLWYPGRTILGHRSQRGACSVNIIGKTLWRFVFFFGLIVCLVGSYRLANESKTKHHVIFFRYNRDDNDIIIL